MRASKCQSRDWILSRRSSFSSWLSLFSCGLARAATEDWLVSFCKTNRTFGSLVDLRSWLMEALSSARMALFYSIIAINCLSSEGTSCLAFETLGNNKEFIVGIKLLTCVERLSWGKLFIFAFTAHTNLAISCASWNVRGCLSKTVSRTSDLIP